MSYHNLQFEGPGFDFSAKGRQALVAAVIIVAMITWWWGLLQMIAKRRK